MKSNTTFSFFLLFILSQLCSIYAQQPSDDPKLLTQILKQSIRKKDTANIVKCYKYLGKQQSDEGEYKTSNHNYQQGLNWAEKSKAYREMGILHNLLASNASEIGNRPLAFAHYHLALKAFAQINELNKVAMVMMNMGTEYAIIGDYSKAIAYELKALKNKEASENTDNLPYYYQHVGELFKNTDVNKWKFYVDKAYAITQKEGADADASTKAGIFNDLGGIAEKQGNYKDAYRWYDSMIYAAKSIDYLPGVSTALSNRSLLYKEEKKLDKALKDALEALRITTELKRTYHMIADGIHVASILLDMNRAAEAKIYCLEALKTAERNNSYPEEVADAHRLLSKIEEKRGEWKEAFLHYKSYHLAIDTIRSAEVQKEVQALETKYKTAEKEIQIEKLDDENQLKSVRLIRIQIIVAALVIIMVLSISASLLWYRKKRLTHQKLQAELKQKLLRSQMNPHFIFNTLNAINHFIQTKQGTEASDYLACYAKLMRQILDNSAAEFVSLESEISFLQNYLSLQKLRFNNSFDYEIKIANNIYIDQTEIPPMLTQPFIENAIEHGFRGMKEAAKLIIEFSANDKNLLITITDNGKGFDTKNRTPQEQTHSTEITEQRLAALGKKKNLIHIESPIEGTTRGTRIKISIPIIH